MTSRAKTQVDRWAQAWQILGSNRLISIWLGLITIAVLLALWIPQAPQSVYNEADGLENWFASVRPQLGPAADILRNLGFLTVQRAAWLRLILSGISVSLTVKFLNTLQSLRNPTLVANPAFSERIELSDSVENALDQLESSLQDSAWPGIRIQRRKIEPYSTLIADRPIAYWGQLLAAVGGLVMIVAWLWTQTAGWESSPIVLTEKQSAEISQTTQTVRLEEVTPNWENAGLAEADLAVFAPESENLLASGSLAVDQPWRWQGITYRLIEMGPAVLVYGTGSDDHAVLLQTAAHRPPVQELTLSLTGQESLRSFAIPQERIVVQVEAEAAETSQVRLRVYQGQAGDLIENQIMDQKTTVAINGASLTLDIIPYAKIIANYAPGRVLLWISGSVAVIGLVLTWLCRVRWVQAVIASTNSENMVELGAVIAQDTSIIGVMAERLNTFGRGDDEAE